MKKHRDTLAQHDDWRAKEPGRKGKPLPDISHMWRESHVRQCHDRTYTGEIQQVRATS